MSGQTCEARVRRGGYFDRHDEMCGKPAKGIKSMSIPYEEWVYTSGISEDRPACGIHLRARYVPGFPKAARA